MRLGRPQLPPEGSFYRDDTLNSEASQNTNPSHAEGFGTPASFSRDLVNTGAARDGLPTGQMPG